MRGERFNELAADFIRKLYPTQKAIPLHLPWQGAPRLNISVEQVDCETAVEKFEQAIARWTGSPCVVATNSGTSALHLALLACGVTRDEMVITVPFTYVATVNAIVYTGAVPLYCDVSPETLGMDPAKLEALLHDTCELRGQQCFHKATGRRVAACLTVYNYGLPYDVDRITALCRAWNLSVVEDAAEAFGTRNGERHAGTFGDVGVISFNRNKTVTTGGGGVLLTSSPVLADRARHLSRHAATATSSFGMRYDELGFNYVMPFVNAQVGLAQLKDVETIIKRKRQLHTLYKSRFREMVVDEGMRDWSPNYWVNLLRFEGQALRDEFVSCCRRHAVDVRPGWPVLDQFDHLKGAGSGDYAVAYKLQGTLAALPGSPDFTSHE